MFTQISYGIYIVIPQTARNKYVSEYCDSYKTLP